MRAVEAEPQGTCVRLEDGTIHCWDEDRDGVPRKGDPRVVAGIRHAARFVSRGCVETVDGKTRCFADGAVIADRPPPWARKGLPAEVAGAVQLDGHSDFACAVMPERHVLCWGENRDGQIGIGAIDEERGVRRPPSRVQKLTDVAAVATGLLHACALRNDGRVVCWGSDECGNLGHPGVRGGIGRARPGPPLNIQPKAKLLRVGGMGGKGCVLTDEGGVWCWGRWCMGIRNIYTRATPPKEIPKLRGAVSIAAHTDGGVAVMPDGKVWRWIDDDKGRPEAFHDVW